MIAIELNVWSKLGVDEIDDEGRRRRISQFIPFLSKIDSGIWWRLLRRRPLRIFTLEGRVRVNQKRFLSPWNPRLTILRRRGENIIPFFLIPSFIYFLFVYGFIASLFSFFCSKYYSCLGFPGELGSCFMELLLVELWFWDTLYSDVTCRSSSWRWWGWFGGMADEREVGMVLEVRSERK